MGWIVLNLKWRNKLEVAAYIVVVWLKINGENASELRDLHEPNYGRLVRILMDKFKKHNMSCVLVCIWVEKCIKVIRFIEHNMELTVWLKFKGNAIELGGFRQSIFSCLYILVVNFQYFMLVYIFLFLFIF